MEEIFPLHQQVIENVFEGVTDEEKKIVIDVLKRVGKKSEQLK